MYSLVLFEDAEVLQFRPLTETRAVFDLRIGMESPASMILRAFGVTEWACWVRTSMIGVTRDTFPNMRVNEAIEGGVLLVNGRWLAEDMEVVARLKRAAHPSEAARVFTNGEDIVAAWLPHGISQTTLNQPLNLADLDDVLGSLPQESLGAVRMMSRLWHVLDDVPARITQQIEATMPLWEAQNKDKPSAQIHPSAVLVEADRIYIAPSAKVRAGAILSATDGPIYIDENAEIAEGAIIKGACYIGAKTLVKMGARIFGSAFGAYCKVGGEISESILHSSSNKGHDGYLGNSYLGKWCNLGADTNTSNLRNDYGMVKLYNMQKGRFELTTRQYLGTIMGDHSKCGINTMFNTGTVIGTFCNIFGSNYQENFVPSFSWGSPEGGYEAYRIEKALHVAEAVMARRDKVMTDADRILLAEIAQAATEI